MAAPSASYLLRRHRTFHFRCCLPVALAAVVGRREFVRTLRTGDIRLARLRASVITLRLPELWARLRMEKVSDDLTG